MDPTLDPSQLPLRDIHLPGAVPFWPPAPGWWLLAAVVLGVLVALAVRRYLHRQQRAALRAITRIRAELESGAEPAECVQRLSSVVRRFAMTTAHDGNERAAAVAPSAGATAATAGGTRLGRDDVAGLVGSAWLRYLDGRWPRDDFARGAGRLLIAAPYMRPEHVDRLHTLELAGVCSEWVAQQRRAHRSQTPHAPRPPHVPQHAVARLVRGLRQMRGPTFARGRQADRRRGAASAAARAHGGARTR